MLNHHDALLKCRNRLLTVQVAGTGVTTLAATGNGFTRATGSFVDDGFVPGMEVQPDGFSDDSPGVIGSVTALEIKLLSGRLASAAAGSRSLTVGIPSIRGWQNRAADPQLPLWFIEEEFMGGPNAQVTLGPLGDMNHYPMYFVRLYAPQQIGVQSLYRLADAILLAFAPRYSMILADNTVLRVRSNPGPTRGQVMRDEDGFVFLLVTIPLWGRTQNSI